MAGSSPDLDMRPLCLWCGKDMWPCRSDKIYCSKTCSDKHDGEIGRSVKAERQCEVCGTTMPVAMRADARFCSRECKDAARERRVERTCAYCGRPFWAGRAPRQKTCSCLCAQRLRRAKG